MKILTPISNAIILSFLFISTAGITSVDARGMQSSADTYLPQLYKNIEDFKSSLSSTEYKLSSIDKIQYRGTKTIEYAALLSKKNRARIIILTSNKNNNLYISESTSELSTEGLTIKTHSTINKLYIDIDAIQSTFITYIFEPSKKGLLLTNIKSEISSISDDDRQILTSINTEFNVKSGDVKFDRTSDTRIAHIKVNPPQCYISDFTFTVDFCARNINTSSGSLTDLMWPE